MILRLLNRIRHSLQCIRTQLRCCGFQVGVQLIELMPQILRYLGITSIRDGRASRLRSNPIAYSHCFGIRVNHSRGDGTAKVRKHHVEMLMGRHRWVLELMHPGFEPRLTLQRLVVFIVEVAHMSCDHVAPGIQVSNQRARQCRAHIALSCSVLEPLEKSKKECNRRCANSSKCACSLPTAVGLDDGLSDSIHRSDIHA